MTVCGAALGLLLLPPDRLPDTVGNGFRSHGQTPTNTDGHGQAAIERRVFRVYGDTSKGSPQQAQSQT